MIYLIGAGGHAKVIAEILETNQQPIAGVFDTDPSKKLWEIPVYTFPGPFRSEKDHLLISVGNNKTRKRIAENTAANYLTAIHPSAQISKRAVIGHGTVIMANVVVNSDSIIGRHCIINTSASVDHDCEIGNYCHISPNATLSGGVSVGECTQIGAGATVIQGVKIGKNVLVGAGSVVIKDIPDNVVVAGCPAKIIKENV